MGKSSKGEVERRVTDIYTLRLACASHEYIVRYASEKWGVSERQVESYITKAIEKEKEEGKQVRENELIKAIKRLEDIYFKAYALQNYSECRLITKDMADLLGLRVVKHEHSGPGGKAIEIAQKEVEKIIDELDKVELEEK